jgi:hypothetical protein
MIEMPPEIAAAAEANRLAREAAQPAPQQGMREFGGYTNITSGQTATERLYGVSNPADVHLPQVGTSRPAPADAPGMITEMPKFDQK